MANGRAKRSCFIFWWFLLILLAGDIEICPGPSKSMEFSIGHQSIRGLTGKIDLLTLFILENNFKINYL